MMDLLHAIIPAAAVELPAKTLPTRDDIAAVIRRGLDGWTPPPPPSRDELQATADELSDMLDLTGEDRYSAETIRDWQAEYAPDDDDEARGRLASHLAWEAWEMTHYPARHNWRRWRLTGRVCSRLYTLGVTSGGHGTTYSGADPFRMVQNPPPLRSFKPGPRPYLLGVHRDHRACLRAQLTGWVHGKPVRLHRPGAHDVWGICGVCAPWPCCGSETHSHRPSCAEAA